MVRLKEIVTMPRNKDLKRLVRARMSKTGESYTASRAQILARSASPLRTAAAVIVAAPPATPRPSLAELAGTRDETLKARTGCTWERWVAALDGLGAERMSHREIAALITRKYKYVNDWWAQTVTVGYERIKGLRAAHQRRDGSFEANKSRTFNVPLASLYDAWADGQQRRRWLDGSIGRVRTSTREKSVRLDGPDASIVIALFQAKGAAKSTVAIQHTKLRDRQSVDQLKQYWAERLDVLGRVLTA